MASYPFSEILVGDKFLFEDEHDASPIKIKTGATAYRLSGEMYVGNGEIPDSTTSHVGDDFHVDPGRPVVKLLGLIEMIEQIQHEIWEMSVADEEPYSEVLDRVIENTSESDDQETDLIHRVAVMIRNARGEGYDGFRFEDPES